MKNLSRDLKEVNPDATCFSETNLLYMKNFYLLYQPYLQIAPQVAEQFTQQALEQSENAITPQLVEQIQKDLFSVPWGHHRFIIDKFKEQPEKATKINIPPHNLEDIHKNTIFAPRIIM